MYPIVDLDLKHTAVLLLHFATSDFYYSFFIVLAAQSTPHSAVINLFLLLNLYFVQLKLVRLVGIMLVVYVRKSLFGCIRDVSEKSVGTGLLGMMVGSFSCKSLVF